MKKILFALTMLAFAVSALPRARGADISIDFIYDNLSGGNWIDAESYGYGWQPDVATSDPNWRPYSDGYWAYTDYGWTWISYEDFGRATYRRERRCRVRYRPGILQFLRRAVHRRAGAAGSDFSAGAERHLHHKHGKRDQYHRAKQRGL